MIYASMEKQMKLSSLLKQEEKEITILFNIKTQVKKTKIDALFDS